MMPIGAFVRIGRDRKGLVRLCRMKQSEYVEDTKDAVVKGQDVDVWIYRLPSTGKLGLSMVPYPKTDQRDPVEYAQTLDKE